MRQDVIKITATLLIPFNPHQRGDTDRAEKLEDALMEVIKDKEGVVLNKWRSKKTRVGVE